MKNSILLIYLLFFVNSTFAQKKQFNNSSFEGIPQAGFTEEDFLSDWKDCGNTFYPNSQNSVFDLQPGFFGVTKDPRHGDSYVGLVARKDGTTEGISQLLIEPLKKDSLYQLSIYLSRSNNYFRFFPVNHLEEKEKKAHRLSGNLRLSIWGSNSPCTKEELLYRTIPIEHEEWYRHKIEFIPKKSYRYITFEASFPFEDSNEKGNLLLDAINLYPFDYEGDEVNDITKYFIEKRKKLNATAAYVLVNTIVNEHNFCKDPCPHIVKIKDLDALKKNSSDPLFYLSSLKQNEIESLKQSLKAVEANEIYDIVERFQIIKNSDSETLENKNFLLNCDKLLEEAQNKKTLDIILDEYVRLKKEEIISEMLCAYK